MSTLFGKKRRGAQAVEFAMALPIMMIVVSATVDYGWYFHQRIALTNATAQAARAGASAEANHTVVASTVGDDIWSATGMNGFPAFNASISGTEPDQLITVTSTIARECLICYDFLPMADTLTHTSTEYIQNQGG